MRWLLTLLLLLLAFCASSAEAKLRRRMGSPKRSDPNYLPGTTICSMNTKQSCDGSPWCTSTPEQRCAPSCDKFPNDQYEGGFGTSNELWCAVETYPGFNLADQWDCCVKTGPDPYIVGPIINVKWKGGERGFCGDTQCTNGERRCDPNARNKCLRDCPDDDPAPNKPGTWCRPDGSNCCARIPRTLAYKDPAKADPAKKWGNYAKCGSRLCTGVEWCLPDRGGCLWLCAQLKGNDRHNGPGIFCKEGKKGFHPNSCCLNF